MQKDHKTKQINPMLGLVARFLLFGILFFVLYQVQLKGMPLKILPLKNPAFLVLAFLAIPLNLWLEWKRYSISLAQRINAVDGQKSFFQGLVVSFFTPQLLATTVGRMSFRSSTINASIVQAGTIAGIAQFLITISFTLFGLWYIETSFSFLFFLFGLFFLLSLFVLFFFVEPLFNRFLARIPIGFLTEKLPANRKVLLLLTSVFRYVVFTLQFHLIYLAFGAEFSVKGLMVLMISYGLIAVSPSLLFGKIVVRESIAVAVFSYYGFPITVVFITAFLTWLMNVVLPVLYAIFILTFRWKSFSS